MVSRFLGAMLLIPAFPMVLCLLTVGTHPKNLVFGFVDEDVTGIGNYCNSYNASVCDFKHTICIFQATLQNSQTISLVRMF